MKKMAFFIILFCFAHAPLQGQDEVTLSGFLRDSANGEALIGANISIPELAKGTASNQYGFFSLTLPAGSYEVVFEYIGFDAICRTLTLTNDLKLTLELRQAAVAGDEVVVSAERADRNVNSIEMSVARLDVKTVEKVPVVLGEADILKTIQLLPGISTAAEGSSGFNVRGGAADQNLVLLDEAPVFNASHLFGFFSVFNADATNDVQIYKGGIPARYGSRLSSVLDVRQKEGNSKSFKASGGLGLIASRLLLEGPINKGRGSYMLAGRRSYGDLFLKLSGNDNTAYFYDLNFKSNYEINSANRIFLSGYFGRDRFEIADIFGTSWGNSAFTLRWNHLFSNKLFSNFSAIYSNYDYSLDILASGASYNWKSNIINTHLKGDLTWFLSDQHQIYFGGNATYYLFQPGKVREINQSNITPVDLDEKFALEPSAYVSHEWKLNSALTLRSGLRFSSFSRLGKQRIFSYQNGAPVIFNQNLGLYQSASVVDSISYGTNDLIERFSGLEPRVSAKVNLGQQQSLKMSYNRTRQYLHLISNTTSPTPLDIWVPSGPFIKPQIADQFAAGYFHNFRDGQIETSVEGFYKTMQNQLDYIDGADLTVNNRLETELLSGEGRAYGMEVYLRKNSGRWSGWLSYTLSRSERQITGLSSLDPGINNGEYYPNSYDKTHDLSLTTIFEPNENWTLSSNFVYQSGRPITYPQGRYQILGLAIPHFEDRNQNRLPAYHRLDLSLTMHQRFGGDWIFSIYNVYNRQNASSITFRENEDQPGLTEAVQTSIFGIVPSITYNVKF